MIFKTTLLASVLCALACVHCFGQGRVTVSNFIEQNGHTINAPFRDENGQFIASADYALQLYAGSQPSSLVPVGPVGTFVGGRAPGIFKGYVVAIPFLWYYDYGWMQVRVWKLSDAPNFEEAALLRKWTAVSSAVFAQARGFPGGVPELPGILVGLQYPGVPLIVEQPRDVALRQGDHITFAVNATGGTQTQYQWIDADSGKSIPGATNAVFTPTEISGSRRFRVKVENSAGSTLSRTAIAFVGLDKPTLELDYSTGEPRLRVLGTSGLKCRLESSDALVGSAWTPLLDFELYDSPLELIDPTAGEEAARFYRVSIGE